MRFGDFEVATYNFGNIRLDGGAMFGAVPKNLWQKLIPPDEQNRIPLATRSLLIRTADRVFLVDVGAGSKWNEKLKNIYSIEYSPLSSIGVADTSITDVILTHLHFDHGGGTSRYDDAGKLVLTYPNARVYLQKENYQNAKTPNVREKASYFPENVDILSQASLELTHGSQEIYPNLWVHQMNGHTRGLQIIELRDGKRSMFFVSDLIPTSHHLPLPYSMGYDICTETVLKEKEGFLSKIADTEAVVVFQHDPVVAAASVTRDKRGHYGPLKQLEF